MGIYAISTIRCILSKLPLLATLWYLPVLSISQNCPSGRCWIWFPTVKVQNSFVTIGRWTLRWLFKKSPVSLCLSITPPAGRFTNIARFTVANNWFSIKFICSENIAVCLWVCSEKIDLGGKIIGIVYALLLAIVFLSLKYFQSSSLSCNTSFFNKSKCSYFVMYLKLKSLSSICLRNGKSPALPVQGSDGALYAYQLVITLLVRCQE